MAEGTEEVKGGFGGIKSLLFKLLPYVLLIIFGAFGGIYTAQQKPQWFGLSKGAAAAQAEADKTISEVSKLIALPPDEKPTIATVTDASKVKDQPFFANAKNGDKVLIYTNANKAILYRPSENRIIEVGAVNIGGVTQPVSQESPSPTTTPKAKALPTPSSSPSPTPGQ